MEFDRFDSAFYPPTPSYNGSYNNSPFSQTSDLPDIDYPKHSGLGLFDHDPLAISSRDEYDPAAYDAPHQHPGLLMFDNQDFLNNPQASPHVAVSLVDDMQSPAYYDHSSPASSNGAETSDDRRSPASSASSHPQPQPSPHLNFHTLHVESPYLGSSLAMPNNDQGSPMVKPQSPPQLLIPDQQPQPQAPAINAPDGDGTSTNLGPRLHIVPATPVSGGGADNSNNNNAQSAAYGQASLLASQGSSARPAGSYAASASAGGGAPYAGAPSSGANFVFPPNSRPDSSALSLSTNGVRGGGATDDFLIPPSPSRGRSKSETSLPAPAWASASALLGQHGHGQQQQHQQQQQQHHLDPFGRQTVNPLSLSDGHGLSMAGDLEGIARPSSASALQTAFNNVAHANANGGNGMGGGAPSPFNFPSQQQVADGYLSPNMGGAAIRRANSDGRGHRFTRSDDLRLFAGTNSLAPYPPSAHQDFLRSTAPHFLSPEQSALGMGGGGMGAGMGMGHHRRTSSGSRERSLGGSPRISPYPSPHASPAHRLEALPNISGTSSRPSSVVPSHAHAHQSSPSSSSVPVPKVNVTTTATAEASYRRRTNDAKFACPVPGCGSTFTRHFNLKGHMRSHNDEKPFSCKWPGCAKGFARQHDCKRHEQLHSNHRPFTCEGCGKPFARLDALNRHLRSEGGAGCAKAQEGAGGADGQQQQQQAAAQDDGQGGLEAWGSDSTYGSGLMM